MMKEFVIPTLVLTIICLVCTGALSVTYATANPVIVENAQKMADETRSQVLSKGENFAPVEGYKAEGDVIDVYKAGNDAGYVVTTQAKGYGGTIKVMMGFTNEGVIDKVKVLELTETQGLGSRVADPKFVLAGKGVSFCDQFTGMDATFGDQMELITGSTISSNAMKSAIATGFEAFNQVKGA